MKSSNMQVFVAPLPRDPMLFKYRGRETAQHRAVFGALDQLHAAVPQVARVIEIGTFYGGFTCILRDHDLTCSPARIPVYSFDLALRRADPVEGVQGFGGSVFVEPQLSRIIKLLQAPGRSVLFCDGGDKEQEVRTFCPHLKPGDIILCHDYVARAELEETAATSGWSCFESRWENIEAALAAANCEPFLADAMQLAVWGCFRRRETPAHDP